MNKSFEILKEIYKPYKITIKGNTTILNTTSGTFAIKKRNNDIRNLYNYLLSRNFDYFPKLIDDTRDELNVYEYVESISMPNDQKANDLIKLIALLHNKTSYNKEVSSDTYKKIYDNINENIDYLLFYYSDLFDRLVGEPYYSPATYLFLRNYQAIFNSLTFSKNELELWYQEVKDKTKQRVSLVHNNLELEHFIKFDKDYIISWDKATIDTPVIDIIHFYRKEFYNIEASSILEEYLNNMELNSDEKKLLFICISIPSKIEFKDNERINTEEVRRVLDYIFKTEKLLKPYYSKDKEE